MILRFASGSVTPASLSRKRPAASTCTSGTSEFSPNAWTTCSASLCLRRPWSTKTHVRLSPMALCTSIAAVLPYPLYSVGDNVDRRPLGLAAAGLVQEVLEDLHPVLRVPDFGMELDPITPLLPVFERDNRDRRRLGRYLETIGDGEDGVAVAGPGFLFVGCAGEEAFVALDNQVGAAVLPDLDGPDLGPLRERHELHPVADAEHRRVELEKPLLHPRSVVLVDAVRTAGEDDPLEVFHPELFYGRIVEDELGVDAGLAHPPGDQLGVLTAKVEDQDQTTCPSRRPGRPARSCPRSRARART